MPAFERRLVYFCAAVVPIVLLFQAAPSAHERVLAQGRGDRFLDLLAPGGPKQVGEWHVTSIRLSTSCEVVFQLVRDLDGARELVRLAEQSSNEWPVPGCLVEAIPGGKHGTEAAAALAQAVRPNHPDLLFQEACAGAWPWSASLPAVMRHWLDTTPYWWPLLIGGLLAILAAAIAMAIASLLSLNGHEHACPSANRPVHRWRRMTLLPVVLVATCLLLGIALTSVPDGIGNTLLRIAEQTSEEFRVLLSDHVNAVLLFGIGLLHVAGSEMLSRTCPAPAVRTALRALHVVTLSFAAALLATTFLQHALPAWSEGFCVNLEYDQYLTMGHLLAAHGEIPLLGPGVNGLTLSVGPLFLWLLGLAQWLFGNDLQAVWLSLVSLNMTSILATGLWLYRNGNRTAAAIVPTILVGCPAIYNAQGLLFWHHPYMLPFVLLFLCASLSFNQRPRLVSWIILLASASLAVQMHASAALLVIPIGFLAVSNQGFFSGRRIGITTLVLLILHFYLLVGADAVLQFLGGGWTFHGSSSSVSVPNLAAGIAAGYVSLGIVLLPAGLAVAAWRLGTTNSDRRNTAAWTCAGLVVSMTSAVVLLVLATGQAWSERYSYVAIPFAALAVWLFLDAVANSIFPRSRISRRLLIVAALPFLLSNSANTDDKRARALNASQDHSVLTDLMVTLAARGLVVPPTGCCAGIHGVPSMTTHSLLVHHAFHNLRAGMQAAGAATTSSSNAANARSDSRAAVLVSFRPDGHFDLEQYEACLDDTPIQRKLHLGPAVINIPNLCREEETLPRFLLLVTMRGAGPGAQDVLAPSLAVEDPPADIPLLPGLADWNHCTSNRLDLWTSVFPVDITGASGFRVNLPPNLKLLDAFESTHPYTAYDFGMVECF